MRTQKLQQIQQLTEKIDALSKSQPQRTSIFDKRVKTMDTEKADPAVVEQTNQMINQMWEIQRQVEAELSVKKGDAIHYLDSKDNTIKKAIVVREGEGELSSFLRIKNDKFIWNQSKGSSVKA